MLVGLAVGMSGALLQAITRNSLASPDTLAVNAGAYLALTVSAAAGVSLPFLSGAGVAFTGGLVAAAVVFALTSGPKSSPIRLILSGSVVALGLSALTTVVLLFFPFKTQSLLAWGSGALAQAGLDGVLNLLPALVVVAAVVFAVGHRLDVLQLGEDAATGLGINVRRWHAIFLVCAVLLAAVAVTAAGPIAFVGLCAPAISRMLIRFIPALASSRLMILTSMLLGIIIVLSADVALRFWHSGTDSVGIPTGILTSLIGAVFIVVVAQSITTGFDTDSLVTMRAGTRLGLKRPRTLIAIAALILVAVGFASVLIGDAMLLTGDLMNYLTGVASVRIDIILDTRIPRIIAALLGGAALAITGAVTQALTRNPLADPGVLGVTGGAGMGAVIMITVFHQTGFWSVFSLAAVCALTVGVLLFGLTGSGGQARMVLVGVGLAAGSQAITTMLLTMTDPYNQSLALTWLSGSTYGVTYEQLIPMAFCLAVGTAIIVTYARDLDIVQMDEFTPRILGIPLTRARIVLITTALIIVAATTVTLGVISFVGLVAPHAARLMIGRRHPALLPFAAALGALLVVTADTFGRTIVAPAQVPAGLVTALIGCPYFLWLMWRMKQDT